MIDYKTFDYENAWDNLALPAFNSLPSNVRALYFRTIDVAGAFGQSKDLSMPWPSEDNAPLFRDGFHAIATEDLAYAARVVYFYGHWHCRGTSTDKVGGTWKFASYCDQELRERLGVEYSTQRGNGVTVRIIEGMLRLCLDTPDSWIWEEVGFATIENLACVRYIRGRVEIPAPFKRYIRTKWDKTEENFRDACKKAQIICTWNDERAKAWLDVGERYSCMHSELTERIDKRNSDRKVRIEAALEESCNQSCAL